MTPKTKLLFLTKCVLVLFSCVRGTISDDLETEKIKAELEINDLELVDMCENIADAKKTAYLTQNYQDKIKQEEAYGYIIKTHFEVLKEFKDVPTELERNLTFQVKPGDGLLPEDKWNKLVLYKNRIEEILNNMKISLRNDSDTLLDTKIDYENILTKSRNSQELQSAWIARQDIYNVSEIGEFSNHLQLLKDAAVLNEFESVQAYWDTLNDFEGAYEQADQFWEEILPFYKKLVNFVKTRLFQYYRISQEANDIPVYLLGTPLGFDWSNIADIILPHPQLHYDVESYLKYKNVEEIYKYSENIVNTMKFGTLGDNFWKNSQFNASVCGPEIFEYCDSGYTEISECNKPSWKVYLDAHETALKIALNNVDYLGLTRRNLRFSAIDNAIETLGSLMAIESLSYQGILNTHIFENITDDYSANMTKLLLTAMRIMPRLSYYLMADKWRLEEIEQNSTGISERWWKYRKEYNGMTGDTNKEPEYLEDLHLLANKPYISKFFGTLVAFQLLEYYRERSENPTNIAEEFGQDDTFMGMIKERHTTDWPYLLTLHYGLEVTASDLLKYFEPLEKYFETAPLEQVAIVTTTTTTSTTTTATTTTSKSTTISKIDLDGGPNGLDSAVVNDEPKVSATNRVSDKNSNSGNASDSHVAMWIGVSLAVVVACLLVAGFGYKTLRKRRRTNNRRFDS